MDLSKLLITTHRRYTVGDISMESFGFSGSRDVVCPYKKFKGKCNLFNFHKRESSSTRRVDLYY